MSAFLPLEPLQSLVGEPAYDTALVTFRRATKDCFVSYDANDYSVPAEYARQELKLKETEDRRLLVLNGQDEVVAEHVLVAGRRQRIAVPSHYANIRCTARPVRRPTAVQIVPVQELAALPAAPVVELRPLSWYDQLVEAVA